MPVAELSEAELVRWGAEFAQRVKLPACIALHGELGAGKTTLVRAMVGAIGCDVAVTSPTYAIVHEYQSARGPVHHLDLYRLVGEHQLPQVGWDDLVSSPGLVLLEWPERAGRALPDGTVHLELAHVPMRPDVRRLTW